MTASTLRSIGDEASTHLMRLLVGLVAMGASMILFDFLEWVMSQASIPSTMGGLDPLAWGLLAYTVGIILLEGPEGGDDDDA